ncbi:MAG: VOC family protein [Archangium sp.]|nr:VOC family protein [Archangium sp.]
MAAKKKKKVAAKKVVKKAAPRKKVSAKKVQAVPSQYGTATPHLIVSPANEAMKFYEAAFGAKTLMTMPGPGGLVMHAELKIGDSIIMLSDQQPPMPGRPEGSPRKSPKNLGGTSGGVMLYVPNIDDTMAKAVAAGGAVSMPAMDMFWGDRYGQIEDPFGHVWAIATHMKDMSPAEMAAAMTPPPPPPDALTES